jgi:hypothetical protein
MYCLVNKENPNKLKHLEFIQLVITRMNVNSFLLKGWVVTLNAAIYAVLIKDNHVQYILIALTANLIFWGLDGYYLMQERRYRGLYNKVIKLEEIDIDFNLDASKIKSKGANWFNSSFSITLGIFYVTLISISICVLINFSK